MTDDRAGKQGPHDNATVADALPDFTADAILGDVDRQRADRAGYDLAQRRGGLRLPGIDDEGEGDC